MNNHDRAPMKTATRQMQRLSRRGLLAAGAVAGMATAMGIPMLGKSANAAPDGEQKIALVDRKNDLGVINTALYYEHQAIWAYNFAATKLTNTKVGKAVLEVALVNLNHHRFHRELLKKAVIDLGGKPVETEASYDLSAYINKGEGNIDSDVNIAKLALALETDAAIAYTIEAAKLTTPALITAGASIGTDEAAHATVIRATFKSLGVNIPIVPAAFFNAETRSAWILKV
jgi:rubrerythrin